MIKKIIILSILANLNLIFGQEKQIVKPNYKLAAKFSVANLKKMRYSTEVKPIWLKKGNRFWYKYKTSKGTNYYLVDADKKKKTLLFDNSKMAKWITEITKDPYDAKHLPYLRISFNTSETAIRFIIRSTEKKTYFLQYVLNDDKITVINAPKSRRRKRIQWANIAPDSSFVLFSKNYNLYWMDKINFLKFVKNHKDSTVIDHKWTQDGVEFFGYGGSSWRRKNTDVKPKKDERMKVGGTWSRDSKKFIFKKTDSRMIKDLWLINSIAKGRPTLETFKYHMAGEQEYLKQEIKIFDLPSKRIVNVELDTLKQQKITIFTDLKKPKLLLSEKNKIYFRTISRDKKKVDICVANITTGKVTKLIKEKFNTYIDIRPVRLFNDEKEILLWSERDGWGHFYLYDSKGNLKEQITSGNYHVDKLMKLDEENRTLYFTANGVEKNQDPYYSHLCKINLDGKEFKNLNAGNYTTKINISKSNKYFISNYSRVNSVPKSELKDHKGKLILELETADLSQLFAAGYKFPEPFKVKAADGITDLYGVLYKPFDFDSLKKYPLLEYVYPGPHSEGVKKSFSTDMHRTDRMAQIGFIVITLGNRGGHQVRSKWYHNYGYGNFRDYALADKKYVAEQLANKYSFIDIDKVGISGHSGGGFLSTAAMLVYPDFFKVAVSSAGNHDNTIFNAWVEKHHGIKEIENKDGSIKHQFQIDDTPSLAKNLKGHLLLITGDMDRTVHPASTIRMVNALIKANKRFDFMMLPGKTHRFGNMREYFFWIKADYFSKHLLNKGQQNVDIIEMNKDKPMTD